MLFNSYIFLFVFLPLTVLSFFVVANFSTRLAAAALAGASLFFYGWWNPKYVVLLLASIVFNYACAQGIFFMQRRGRIHGAKYLLMLAIAGDLALLIYYKYASFFLGAANELVGTAYATLAVILPLGISFFTFTQITFLADAYQRKATEHNFIHYALFVTYFPHLIAGPILHHAEMMPQFAKRENYRFRYENAAVGLGIFVIGLFKKVMIADSLAPDVGRVFDAAASGTSVPFLDAWGGALAYTLQLYFDFSGYSDMAIGASRLFGIVLPANFDSPYKARNIIDFWRRWHMTLSRFLREYLYIPLGGNRKGRYRRYMNLLVTMVLGGLWHGAGWTFVLWGTLHGLYLIVNHAWLALTRGGQLRPLQRFRRWSTLTGYAVTFLAIVVGWVIFRAPDVDTALALLRAMTGLHGLASRHISGGALRSGADWALQPGLVPHIAQPLIGIRTLIFIALLFAAVWLLPNTQQLFAKYRPVLIGPEQSRGLSWKPTRAWATAAAIVALLTICSLHKQSEFLYFQF